MLIEPTIKQYFPETVNWEIWNSRLCKWSVDIFVRLAILLIIKVLPSIILLNKKMKIPSRIKSLSRSKLIKIAILTSIFTILWNVAEGVVSVLFGVENESVSLIFFGINSFIEVSSASIVY